MTGGLRSTEVVRRLGLDGADVYRLLFVGELDGGPGSDGLVYFSEASVDAYLDRYGFGNLSNNLSNEPRGRGRRRRTEPAARPRPTCMKTNRAVRDITHPAPVDRAHNPKVAGSNPAPATKSAD